MVLSVCSSSRAASQAMRRVIDGTILHGIGIICILCESQPVQCGTAGGHQAAVACASNRGWDRDCMRKMIDDARHNQGPCIQDYGSEQLTGLEGCVWICTLRLCESVQVIFHSGWQVDATYIWLARKKFIPLEILPVPISIPAGKIRLSPVYDVLLAIKSMYLSSVTCALATFRLN